MSTFAVSTKFLAHDRLSRAFKVMGREADRFGSRADKSFRRASRSGSRLKGIMGGVLGALAVGAGVRKITQGVFELGRQFVSLDDAMFSAAAKFADVNLATTEGWRQMELLRKSAREVGAATEFTATQAGKGLDFLALAGFNSVQAMSSLPGVVDLATVAQIDLARATDIASDVLGAFGLMTKDNVQLQKNLTRVNDVMSLTMSRTNTNIEDMFEAIKKGGPVFQMVGSDIESFSAMLGIMAGKGIKAGEGGTQLRNFFLKISNPAADAQRALAALGVEIKNTSGGFRDPTDIIRQFEKGIERIGGSKSVLAAKALSTIFGVRSVTGLAGILDIGSEELIRFRKEMYAAGGTSQRTAEIMRRSLGNKIRALQSAALEKGFQILDAFQSRGKKGLDAFTDWVRKLNVQPAIDFLEKMYKAAQKITTAFAPAVSRILPLAVTLFGKFADLLVKISPLIEPLTITFLAYTTAVKVAAAAQWLLNVAMGANPIGLIIIGVAALITGLIALVDNWDTVRNAMVTGWAYAKRAFFSFAAVHFKLLGGIIKLALRGAKAVGKFFGADTSGIDTMIARIDGLQMKLNQLSMAPDPILAHMTSPGILSTRGGSHTVDTSQAALFHAIEFQGQLDISGAPEGSKVSGKSSAGSMKLSMLGVAP